MLSPRILSIIIIVIMGVLLLSSCGGSEPASPAPAPPAPAPTAIDANAIYTDICTICHGANREGVSGLGPALTQESLAALSDIEIKDAILNGRPGTSMTGFKDRLGPEEINALLQLIKYTSP